MKCVILAGGMGTRFSEETDVRPKPMIEIGGKPILWHIMKMYSAHGINDFVVCCGYKGYVIKEYFMNYGLHMSDVTIDLQKKSTQIHNCSVEPWCVTLIDTGADTMTGGRLKRIREYVGNETFCMTYGDGVSDVDIGRTIRFHKEHWKLATVTAVQPPGRFGSLSLDETHTKVSHFIEKPQGDSSYINGGFFVLEPQVFDLIENDRTIWEQEPMRELANRGQLMSYVHDGFWHAMDTLRDKRRLEELWSTSEAPWMRWNQ